MANHNNFLEINYSRKIKLSAPTIFLKINHCLDPSRAGPGPVQAGLQPRASKKGRLKKKLPHPNKNKNCLLLAVVSISHVSSLSVLCYKGCILFIIVVQSFVLLDTAMWVG